MKEHSCVCRELLNSIIESVPGIIYYIQWRLWQPETENVTEMETGNVYHSRAWQSRQGVSEYKT